jgi:hypothetical protein
MEPIIKKVGIKRISLIAFSLEFVNNAGKPIERIIMIVTLMGLLAKRELFCVRWILLCRKMFQLVK